MEPASFLARCATAPTVRQACEAVADELRARGVALPSIYLLIGQRLRCQAAGGYFQVVDGFRPGSGIIGRSVATGTTLVVPDVREDSYFIGATPGIVGEISVPVMRGGRVLGAVNAESTGELPAEWLPMLEAAATALADRIEELGGLGPESLMQRLAKVAVELTTQTDARAIEHRAVLAAIELSEMTTALIARRSSGGSLGVTTAQGPHADDLRGLTAAELAVMAGWVEAGTSSHFPGRDSEPAPYPFLARAGFQSLCVYPLIAGGDSSGMLAIADARPHPYLPQVVEALELLSALAASALGSVSTLADLRRRATQDPLTTCGNVAAFTADLDAVLRGLPRDHEVACLMIDIDHFKAVNDNSGHPAGDLVLQSLSEAMRTVLRSNDQLYRVGGDEFAVIAVVVDATQALQLAERLVHAARQVGAPVSIGTACAHTGTSNTLRARADDALYAAKRSGRNQTLLAL